MQIVFNPETGKSKGFGFVKFEDARDAEDAIDQANGKVRRFVDLHIRWPVDCIIQQALPKALVSSQISLVPLKDSCAAVLVWRLKYPHHCSPQGNASHEADPDCSAVCRAWMAEP